MKASTAWRLLIVTMFVCQMGWREGAAATHYVVPTNLSAANPYTNWGTAGTNIIDVVNAAMTNATTPRVVWGDEWDVCADESSQHHERHYGAGVHQ